MQVLKKELKGKRAVTPSSARQRPAFQPPAQSAAQTQPHLGGLLELDNPGQPSQVRFLLTQSWHAQAASVIPCPSYPLTPHTWFHLADPQRIR